MANYYFTADPHLNHKNIIKYCARPFMSKVEKSLLQDVHNETDPVKARKLERAICISNESLDRMEKAIISNINAVVEPDDYLAILGDFAFVKTEEQLRYYRNQINCKNIIMILGNHDNRRLIQKVFDKVYDTYMLKVNFNGNHQQIWLSHYAHAVWPNSHRGCIHLYGHSHQNFEFWKNEHLPHAKMMDVGVDCNDYKPFSLEDIMKIMNSKKGQSVDFRA
ncbi:MAG: metallophosphoesterase [Atribacterota bacterium]